MRIMNKPDGGYIDSRLKFGGSSIYQHGKNLYLVTSRLRIPETKTRKRTRHLYIYKLNDEWNDFDNNFTPITWEWNRFESPMITRRKKQYYIFASRTRGYQDSKTYYRKAKSWKKLANAKTHEVVMHPADTPNIKSMGSQFCYFRSFAPGKWIFGGRRKFCRE